MHDVADIRNPAQGRRLIVALDDILLVRVLDQPASGPAPEVTVTFESGVEVALHGDEAGQFLAAYERRLQHHDRDHDHEHHR